jgi:hypothetical protein
MLQKLWNRFVRHGPDVHADDREAEREKMSDSERHFTGESVDDIQADDFVSEHLGAIKPDRLVEDDRPPRS